MGILVNSGVACLKRPEAGAGTKIALCYGVRTAHREPLGKKQTNSVFTCAPPKTLPADSPPIGQQKD